MNDDLMNARRYPSYDASDPTNAGHPSVDLLSENLDMELASGQAGWDAIEGHLRECQQCQHVVADLRLMVQTLQSLPEVEVPRSFAIVDTTLEPAATPELPEPIRLQETPQWHTRHAAKVRLATAVAAMLFVFVISADLVTNGLTPRMTGTMSDEIATTMLSDGDSDGFRQMAEPDAFPAAADDMVAMEEEGVEHDYAAPPAEGAIMYEDESDSDEAEALRLPGEQLDLGADEEAVEMSAEVHADENVSAVEETARSVDASQMRWRIAEVGLALVLALLLAAMIGLPRQRGKRQL